MSTEALSLMQVYEGWEGHQLALTRAVATLTPEQFAYRPKPDLRSVGELLSHISLGRVDWFHRMGAPGSAELARQFAPGEGEKANTEDPAEWRAWMEAVGQREEAIINDPAKQRYWLEASWQMIETTLTHWTTDDLAKTYRISTRGRCTPYRASGPSGASCPMTSIMAASCRWRWACKASRFPIWVTRAGTSPNCRWRSLAVSHRARFMILA